MLGAFTLRNIQRALFAICIFVCSLYSLDQAGLSFIGRFDQGWSLFLKIIVFICLITGMFIAVHSPMSKDVARIYFVFGLFLLYNLILLVLFYDGDAYWLFVKNKFSVAVKAFCIFFVLSPILSSYKSLQHLINLHLTFGVVLMALNAVVLADLSGVIELSNEQMSRFGGERGLEHLDPISYGIFGIIENHGGTSITGLPRFQGFSSEPQHWAFFVLVWFKLSLLNLFLFKPQNLASKFLILSTLSLSILHIVLSSSTTSLILLMIFFGLAISCTVAELAKRRFSLQSLISLSVILVPGLVFPMLVILADVLIATDVGFFLMDLNLLGEQQNWSDKFNFLAMGQSLICLECVDISTKDHFGHNFVLHSLYQYGFFLTTPLLLFLLALSISTNEASRLVLRVFGSCVIVLLTLGFPGLLFSGLSMFLLMLPLCLSFPRGFCADILAK